MDSLASQPLTFPHAEPPPPAEILRVAPGIHWLRMPLPFRLDHINLWLIEDGEGFCIVDTGINMSKTRELWETLFKRHFGARPVTRVIVTHMHPDHVGTAGWLCQKWNAPLYMSLGEYHSVQNTIQGFGDAESVSRRSFYLANGIPEAKVGMFESHRGGYRQVVSAMPPEFVRLREGHDVMVGGRAWRPIMGYGHSPEHVALYCAELKVLIAGDQVLPKITTNVSVWPIEPLADSLTWFIESTKKMYALAPDTLVLPSHGLPFRGLHARADQLIAHHDERLDALRAACAAPAGLTGVESVPALFPGRELDEHQFVFALGETLAHLHCLETRGQAERLTDSQGIHRFRTLGEAPSPPALHDVDEPEMV
jgi:glyoxylase-like metal-dependent hydrolase (beta-lactamase superfamily II)